MESVHTFTLIAYKPNGSSRNCGRGCCGSTRSDSDFVKKRGLTLGQLAEEIAKLRISYVDAHGEDYRGEPYEVHYFDDTATSDWEWNDEREDYWSDTGFNEIDKQLETLISQQQPIIKQRQEQEAAEAAAKAAEAERISRVKWEAEERERRDREEYLRLQAKYKK